MTGINIGTNISGPTCYPFLNIMKYSWYQGVGAWAGNTTSGVWSTYGFNNAVTANNYGNSSSIVVGSSSPMTTTWTNHALVAGAGVKFSTNIGGISGGVTYLVSSNNLTSNTFQVTDFFGNTIIGSGSTTTTCNADDFYNFYKFYLDSNGYPRTLTTTLAGAPPHGFNASTFGGYGVNAEGLFKAGNYVFLYEGSGSFQFFTFNSQSDISAISSVQDSNGGRIVLNSHFDDLNGLAVWQFATGSGNNYAKNFRLVWSPDSTANGSGNSTGTGPGDVIGVNEALVWKGEILNPLFRKLTQPYTAVRFMGMSSIIFGNVIQNWADRTPKDWISYNENINSTYPNLYPDLGCVPLEIQIEICNRLNCHGWFNIPSTASVDFMYQFGNLVAQNLNPPLKAYVEFANELWNYYYPGLLTTANNVIFPGWQLNTTQLQLYGGSIRSVQVGNLWQDAFSRAGKDKTRVRRVAPGQGGYIDRNAQLLVQPGSQGGFGFVDSFGYVNVNIGSTTSINWANHGLAANTPVKFSGTTLPTGIVRGTSYFVINSGMTANTFEISNTVGGAVLVTSGSQSDDIYPLFSRAGFPWPAVTLTTGNPTIVNWPNHGLPPGMSVGFMGTLPTGMDGNTTYFVINSNNQTNTFEISNTVNGTPLVTSGTSSGVQPIYFAGRVKDNIDTFCTAQYFGYSIPNSWSGNDGDPYQRFFTEMLIGGELPTTATVANCGGNSTVYTVNTGLSLPATPDNGQVVCWTIPNNNDAFNYSATVTISNNGGNCVVTWNEHGLTGGDKNNEGYTGTPIQFRTTGALPTGLSLGNTSPFATYYIGFANVTTNTFVVTSDGFTPVVTSGTQTGTHTCYTTNGPNIVMAADGGTAWPLFDYYGCAIRPGLFGNNFIIMAAFTKDTWQHNVGAAVTITVNSNTVTMNIANSTVTWANHNLVNSYSILFSTTGTLPTGIIASNTLTNNTTTTYWISNTTTNTFKLLDINGNPITLSGSQSGVHTAAGPTVISLANGANHNLLSQQNVCFSTTGTLPSGLNAGQAYFTNFNDSRYNNIPTGNTFLLAYRDEGGPAGPYTDRYATNYDIVMATGTQSGTQTLFPVGWQIFNVYGQFDSAGIISQATTDFGSPGISYDFFTTPIAGGFYPGNTHSGMVAQENAYYNMDAQLCLQANVTHCAYESGQSLLSGGGFSQNEVVGQQVIYAVQHDPRMYEAYIQLFTAWAAIPQSEINMNFADIGPDGTFGVWENLNTVYATHSPRYDAVKQMINPSQRGTGLKGGF